MRTPTFKENKLVKHSVKMTVNENIESNLSYFSGTEQWHRLTFLPVLGSDGVKYLAEKAEAFWLIDAIAAHLPAVKATGDRMATVKLLKRKHDWLLTLETLDKTISQEIEYSDFQFNEITLYLCDNGFSWCLLLPNEY